MTRIRKLRCQLGLLAFCLFASLLFSSIHSWPQASLSSNRHITIDNGPNSPEQQSKHYVILVSLDGFRYDYAKKYGAKNILDIAAHGASAPDGMIPAYPSLTFPNHYSIITGLYPEHHGIVANRFYDPARKAFYSMSDQKTNSDGSWYGGVPIWSLAEQQEMRAADLFWPGSEAEIAGERPSYYFHFDDSFPDGKRVDQVIEWLKLPPAQRPHFITLYYSTVDHAGHTFGPDAKETADAVQHVDVMMGRLMDELKTVALPVDLFIVADHGMTTGQGDWINLENYADLSNFVTAGALLYPKTDADAEKAFQQLNGKSDKFLVFRRKDMPAELHNDSNPRSGDPIVVATGPYYIRAHASATKADAEKKNIGLHGLDPYKMKNMRAVFIAEGPDIRPGVTVTAFENVNVYPLIAKILGLRIGAIDGKLDALQAILQTSGRKE